MPKLWRIQPYDRERIAALGKASGVSPVVAQLLMARGIVGQDEIRDFLECKLSSLRDPALLPGVREAAALLMSAVRERRKIPGHGDYGGEGIAPVPPPPA